jgi:hypothetical protein
MRLCDHGREVIFGILLGTRSHKDLKEAFLWEDTAEGHGYWSRVRQAPGLTHDAAAKLARAVNFIPEPAEGALQCLERINSRSD